MKQVHDKVFLKAWKQARSHISSQIERKVERQVYELVKEHALWQVQGRVLDSIHEDLKKDPK